MAKKKRDQFDRNRILFIMNQVAKERRMARCSGCTAAHVCGSYTMWKDYGYGAKRLTALSKKIDKYIDDYENGLFDLDAANKKLHEIAGLGLTHKEYEEGDLRYSHGFRHYVESKQLMPQNEVNRFATEYTICLLTIMHEEEGWGKERLIKLHKNLVNRFNTYCGNNQDIGQKMLIELRDYAGFAFESPVDPLTHEAGSLMVGM